MIPTIRRSPQAVTCQNANHGSVLTPVPDNIVVGALNGSKETESSYSTAGSNQSGWLHLEVSLVATDPAMLTTDQSSCTQRLCKKRVVASMAMLFDTVSSGRPRAHRKPLVVTTLLPLMAHHLLLPYYQVSWHSYLSLIQRSLGEM